MVMHKKNMEKTIMSDLIERKARTICPCPVDRYMGPEGYCSKAEPKEADDD